MDRRPAAVSRPLRQSCAAVSHAHRSDPSIGWRAAGRPAVHARADAGAVRNRSGGNLSDRTAALLLSSRLVGSTTAQPLPTVLSQVTRVPDRQLMDGLLVSGSGGVDPRSANADAAVRGRTS